MRDFFILSGVWGVSIFLSIIILRFIILSYVHNRQKEWSENLESVLLQIKVFKDNEKGPLAMEQIFSSIHGLLEKITLIDWFRGKKQAQISFEIANINKKIFFYVWVPEKFKSFIEGQIYAQYPEVEIDEVEDYVKCSGNTMLNGVYENKIDKKVDKEDKKLMLIDDIKKVYAITAELELSEANLLPIKRYSQFEDKLARIAVDPLAGITAALAKVNSSKEQMWLQLVVVPTGDKWRQRALKGMKIMKKLFSKWLFKNSFYLQGWAAKIYTEHRWWKRIILIPVFIVLWFYRGGGQNSILENDSAKDQNADDIKDEVSKNHDRETSESAMVSKISMLGFDSNIRFIYIPEEKSLPLAQVKLNSIASSFKQFNLPQLNSFVVRSIDSNNNQILRRFKHRSIVNPFVLNVEELATVYHFPNTLVSTPNIQWVTSKRLEPPSNLPSPEEVPLQDFTMLGETNYRGLKNYFGIKRVDRRRHIYIIGKTGMGKSTILENMIFSDVSNNRGIAVIDPHGDLANAVLDFTPSYRTNDVIVFDPSDKDFPIAFNMLECKNPEHRTLVASGLLGVFKKLYANSWGPRLEHILRNTLLALIEYPNTTMLGIMRLLVDKSFRKKVVSRVTDPVVKSFWVDEFEKMQDRQRTEAISPIQNKVGQFLSSNLIRNIVGQPKSSVDIRFAMDKKKIFVVNLSKGKIGEDNSALLGSMLITKFQLDAMSRADIDEKDRVDFYLYVDEFQNFATDSFATILSEARKYKLNLTMANQYIAQMSEEVSSAVFGNVGTIVSFQVGYDDAEYLSRQFSEEVTFNDIVNLPKYKIYTKLMIDGMPSKVFSADTLCPPEYEKNDSRRNKIMKVSREKYSTKKEIVEDKITRWAKIPEQPKIKKKTKTQNYKNFNTQNQSNVSLNDDNRKQKNNYNNKEINNNIKKKSFVKPNINNNKNYKSK